MNKKQLFENIMKNVSKSLKTTINEEIEFLDYNDSDPIVYENALFEIHKTKSGYLYEIAKFNGVDSDLETYILAEAIEKVNKATLFIMSNEEDCEKYGIKWFKQK